MRAENKHIDRTDEMQKLIDRASKITRKVKEAKKSTKQVTIKCIDNKTAALFSKDDIKNIRQSCNTFYSRRLLYTLLAIHQKLDGRKFIIARNKKDCINQTQICKLANISDRHYHKGLDELNDIGILKTSLKPDGSLTLTHNFLYAGEQFANVSIIEDINDCHKVVNREFRSC